MKQLFRFSFMLLALLLPITVTAHDFEVDGIYYNFINDNEVAVTYRGSSANEYSDEYIGDVTIPAIVTYYGTTYSVSSIGRHAFYYCRELTSVAIPISVTSIGEYAFYEANGLTNIVIPASIISIGRQAFEACYGLTSVYISDLEAWCNISFLGRFANPVSSAHHLFLNGQEIKDLIIPSSITSIGNYAFEGCSGLTSVTIPSSVTSIGIEAFYGCTGLSNVTIPDSVISIGDEAFRNCDLINLTIGTSVTSIGDEVFGQCQNLRNLYFNAVNCISIGNHSFDYLYYSNYINISVPYLRFGDNVQNIPAGLPSLKMGGKTLIIPNGVKTINTNAIKGNCDAVIIGNDIENISSGAFSSGIRVAYVTSSDPRPCEPGAFANPQILYVPIGSKVKYFTASGWGEFANIIESDFEYVSVDSIILDKTSVVMPKNATLQLTATVYPDSTSTTTIDWYSMNTSIATVSNNGLVTAVAVGETDIVAQVDNAIAVCHVKVTPIWVETITLSDNHLSMSLDETHTLTATVTPDHAENKTLEWVVPDNDIIAALIINDKKVNIGAIGEGTVIITVKATDGSGVSASCEVFVSANTPVKSLTLSPETMTLYVGYSEQLNATITPQDAYIQDLRWFSSNTAVATVDNNGRVTGRSVGTATITAFTTDGSNLNATCAVTVTNIPVESVTLDYSEIEMYEGNSTYLYATVLPNNAMNQTLRWESSNPRVATVSSNGMVNALEVGTTIITAISTDGTDISAACRVNVINYLTSNCFSMPDSKVLHGESVTIPVRLTNNQDILAFQTNIYLPEGFNIATDENDEFLIVPSSRLTNDHVLMADRLGDGGVRVICYTPQEVPINGYEGDLFYITITAPDHAAHDYAINLRNSLLTNTNYQELTIPDAGAVLSVNTFMMGDANDSHSVSVTDIVVTAQYVLGRNPSPFIYEAADMNGDGNITVTDIMLIAYLINHPTMNAPKRMPALMNVGDRMSGEDVTLMAGETRTVSIKLENMTDYTAFQMDLTLPTGLTASNFALTDRAGSHALDVNTLDNGKTRALCYSSAIEAIEGHEGALLTFDVKATGDIESVITVDGIELVTSDCQTVLLDAFTIGVNNDTSVNELATGKTVARVEYFNLAGQQIERPDSGVALVVTTYTDGTRSTTKVIK